jgi:Putative  PD-(D/E)XK family member, (DUF4420)
VTPHNSVDKRHLSTESFDQYLDSRVPVILPVPGRPEAFVFIDPFKPELGIRIAFDTNVDAPATGLRNIIARIAIRDGKRFLEAVVTDATLFRDAYPVLCSMADRVQIGRLSPSAALRATLEKMSSLLNPPDTMSREREVGLLGELLLVGGLISVMGVDDAVRAWRGGLAEEHDIGLRELDIEVKTTTSERRVHWIESLTQLVPTRDRPLWLVSHQLTAAGSGEGQTLPALVAILRTSIGAGPARDAFENALEGSGWRDQHCDQLLTRWTRRTDSVAYLVGDWFPRLTPDALRDGGISLERVPEVRYRIDLDSLMSPVSPPPMILTAIKFQGRT